MGVSGFRVGVVGALGLGFRVFIGLRQILGMNGAKHCDFPCFCTLRISYR